MYEINQYVKKTLAKVIVIIYTVVITTLFPTSLAHYI